MTTMYEVGTITNNEGKKIIVSLPTLDELAQLYFTGCWSAIVKDKVGLVHCVIIPDNKKALGIK